MRKIISNNHYLAQTESLLSFIYTHKKKKREREKVINSRRRENEGINNESEILQYKKNT